MLSELLWFRFVLPPRFVANPLAVFCLLPFLLLSIMVILDFDVNPVPVGTEGVGIRGQRNSKYPWVSAVLGSRRSAVVLRQVATAVGCAEEGEDLNFLPLLRLVEDRGAVAVPLSAVPPDGFPSVEAAVTFLTTKVSEAAVVSVAAVDSASAGAGSCGQPLPVDIGGGGGVPSEAVVLQDVLTAVQTLSKRVAGLEGRPPPGRSQVSGPGPILRVGTIVAERAGSPPSWRQGKIAAAVASVPKSFVILWDDQSSSLLDEVAAGLAAEAAVGAGPLVPAIAIGGGASLPAGGPSHSAPLFPLFPPPPPSPGASLLTTASLRASPAGPRASERLAALPLVGGEGLGGGYEGLPGFGAQPPALSEQERSTVEAILAQGTAGGGLPGGVQRALTQVHASVHAGVSARTVGALLVRRFDAMRVGHFVPPAGFGGTFSLLLGPPEVHQLVADGAGSVKVRSSASSVKLSSRDQLSDALVALERTVVVLFSREEGEEVHRMVEALQPVLRMSPSLEQAEVMVHAMVFMRMHTAWARWRAAGGGILARPQWDDIPASLWVACGSLTRGNARSDGTGRYGERRSARVPSAQPGGNKRGAAGESGESARRVRFREAAPPLTSQQQRDGLCRYAVNGVDCPAGAERCRFKHEGASA